MTQDPLIRCAGRVEEISLMLDGGLTPADAAQLDRHLASCAACQRLAASLRQVDSALAARFVAPALAAAFDRSVLARIDALRDPDAASPVHMQARAELDRDTALARLRTDAGSGLGGRLLDLAGVWAVLWAGGHLAPHLLEVIRQQVAAAPGVADIAAAVTIAALAMAAAYLVARVPHLTVAD